MTSAQQTIAAHMSEDDLLDAVITLARMNGWLVDHPRPARTANGWRTALRGHAGRPDLFLVHPSGRVITAELKSEKGKLSRYQKPWDEALRVAAQRAGIGSRGDRPVFSHYVWRPTDWVQGSIREALAR